MDKDLLAEWDLRLACIADERDHLRSRPPVGVLEAIFAMPFPPERQFASVIRRWEWAHRHRHSHDSLPRTLSQHKQYQTGDLESDLWQQGDAVRSSRSQRCLTVVTMAGIWPCRSARRRFNRSIPAGPSVVTTVSAERYTEMTDGVEGNADVQMRGQRDHDPFDR